ncbi:MAG: hypothetical protein WBV98_03840 [Candidatus Sulfotelmatobacter sp.]
MNIESTMDTSAVVTPNCAMANRNQTSSYKMLQKPEMKKKTKYRFINPALFLIFKQKHGLEKLATVAPSFRLSKGKAQNRKPRWLASSRRIRPRPVTSRSRSMTSGQNV